jgi:DNA-binding XRE family transcriptional regulator
MEGKHPLAAWRETEGVQQIVLANDLGVKRWTIFAIETRLRKPSPELAKKIAERTGIARHALRPDLWDAA